MKKKIQIVNSSQGLFPALAPQPIPFERLTWIILLSPTFAAFSSSIPSFLAAEGTGALVKPCPCPTSSCYKRMKGESVKDRKETITKEKQKRSKGFIPRQFGYKAFGSRPVYPSDCPSTAEHKPLALESIGKLLRNACKVKTNGKTTKMNEEIVKS